MVYIPKKMDLARFALAISRVLLLCEKSGGRHLQRFTVATRPQVLNF